MGKKLISCQCLDTQICREEQRIYIDSTMILAPGAKDELRRRGVEIVYSSQPSGKNSSWPAPESTGNERTVESGNSELVERIVEILSTEYGVTDGKKIMAISLQVIEKLGQKA
jgi:hypothetical protein